MGGMSVLILCISVFSLDTYFIGDKATSYIDLVIGREVRNISASCPFFRFALARSDKAN